MSGTSWSPSLRLPEPLIVEAIDTAPSTPDRRRSQASTPSPATPSSAASSLSSYQADTPITPPLTPEVRPKSLSGEDVNDLATDICRFEIDGLQSHKHLRSHTANNGSPLPKGRVNAIRLDKMIGTGQWSKVYSGVVSESKNRHSLPPSSSQTIVAVKLPTDRLSVKVVQHEICVLTSIASIHGYGEFVSTFFGTDLNRTCIVIEHIDRSLDEIIGVQSFDPGHFTLMAAELVKGLAFLHNTAKVVHGDVKPANIRLRQSLGSNVPQPIFCDFSAAHCVECLSPMSEGAGTYHYMAPELFSIDSRPTTSADVYALGMTLLHALSEQIPYSDCSNTYMLRNMAMQGRPLDFIPLSDDKVELSRVVLKPALQSSLDYRISAHAWLEKIHGFISPKP